MASNVCYQIEAMCVLPELLHAEEDLHSWFVQVVVWHWCRGTLGMMHATRGERHGEVGVLRRRPEIQVAAAKLVWQTHAIGRGDPMCPTLPPWTTTPASWAPDWLRFRECHENAPSPLTSMPYIIILFSAWPASAVGWDFGSKSKEQATLVTSIWESYPPLIARNVIYERDEASNSIKVGLGCWSHRSKQRCRTLFVGTPPLRYCHSFRSLNQLWHLPSIQSEANSESNAFSRLIPC